MKKSARLIALFAIGCVGLLASCNNGSNLTGPGGQQTVIPSSITITYKGQSVENGDSFNTSVGETIARFTCADERGVDRSNYLSFSSSDPSVVTIDSMGLMTPLKAGSSTITITSASEAIDAFSISVTVNVSGTTTASQIQSYSTVSYDEKANILGALEDYAVENYLTGITLFSNGGYVVYNDRYHPAPREYVSGYGWGTMKEGRLTADLNTVPTNHDPSYYQIGTVTIAGHANAMDASGSDVSDIASYFTTSYYSTRLNATNDGYEWYPSLATDNRPVAVNDRGEAIQSNYNRRWRIHLRSGDSAPVYRTASTQTFNGVNVGSFNKQQVELEDYLTPFKVMLTSWNGQYRGSELTDGVSGFTGAASYFNATSNNPGDGSIVDEDAWDRFMGNENGYLEDQNGNQTSTRGNIIVGHDDEGDYIEFNLLYPCTQFYAMYYLSSSLYSPLPMRFVQAVTPTNLGQFPSTTIGPKDTMLYTGPYFVEAWTSGSYIKLTRNDDFYEYKESQNTDRPLYQIPGFEYQQYSSSNLEYEFESGHIDSYTPTKETLDKYRNAGTGTSNNGVHWTAYQTKGDSNFKLNINSLTPEEWKKRFGTSGTVYAHDSKQTDEWVREKERRGYLSDKDFLDFLSFSLDRQTICEDRGMTPTQDYFSDNYLIDPENGVSYNYTDAHKAVLADRYNSTYGYSPDAAKKSLRNAMENTIIPMVEKGLISAKSDSGDAGTPENKYQVVINMNWMNPDDEKNYGDVFNSIRSVFDDLINDEYEGGYELVINQIAGDSDFNKVYDWMKQGEFDLGFGAVSGNDLNPINFFEVLKGDNSSGFTLNWGPDTSVVDPNDPIVYDGKTWSFDGLWQAADSAALLNNDGTFAAAQNVSGSNGYQEKNDTNRTVTYRISFEQLIQAGASKLSLSITNGEYVQAISNEDLESMWGSNHVATITLDNRLNSMASGNQTVTTRTVTLTVNFEITFNDAYGNPVTTETSSTLSLLSYAGL